MLRARTTTGLSVVGLTGGFFTRQAPDVQLSVMDEDKAIGVILKQDGKIKDRDLVGLQVAMLYTTLGGERRIRVWNKMFRVDTQICKRVVTQRHCSKTATETRSWRITFGTSSLA